MKASTLLCYATITAGAFTPPTLSALGTLLFCFVVAYAHLRHVEHHEGRNG